jgi:hypothetical protein
MGSFFKLAYRMTLVNRSWLLQNTWASSQALFAARFTYRLKQLIKPS